MMDLLWLLLKDAFWSAIPAVGFAMLFNVPPRMLKYCAMGGALAHSLRTLLMHEGMPIEWATLAAATTVGFVCSIGRGGCWPRVPCSALPPSSP